MKKRRKRTHTLILAEVGLLGELAFLVRRWVGAIKMRVEPADEDSTDTLREGRVRASTTRQTEVHAALAGGLGNRLFL